MRERERARERKKKQTRGKKGERREKERGEREDIRTQLMESMIGTVIVQGFSGEPSSREEARHFGSFGSHTKLQVILGRRIGNAAAEKGIDIAVKTFIRKAWLRRKDTRIHLNTLLGRTDV